MAFGRIFGRKNETTPWKWHLFAVIAANAADFDFIPGLLIGDINRFHQGPTHSILAALLFGGIAAMMARSFSIAPLRFWVAGALVYASHLLLDFFTRDIRAPFGQPLLWPFSKEHYISPWPIFRGVKHGVPGEDFFAFLGHLFSFENLITLGLEVLIVGPILLLCWAACGGTDRHGAVERRQEVPKERTIDSRER